MIKYLHHHFRQVQGQCKEDLPSLHKSVKGQGIVHFSHPLITPIE